MNPEQTPPSQYPIDYLNQIAPQQPKRGIGNKWLVPLAIGGFLIVLAIGALILSSAANAPKTDMQKLAAKLSAVQTITKDSQRTIKSTSLRSTNSNLNIFLTDANRDIADPLSASGIDTKKVDKSLANTDKVTKTLEEARLNAIFDRTYAREMAYQLETIGILMQTVYRQTNSKSMKAFLEKTDTNLQPIHKALSEFTDSNS